MIDLQNVREYLLPATERDPRFRDHLRQISCPGLATLGVVEIAVPVFMTGGRMALAPETSSDPARLWQAAAMILVGVLTVLLARMRWASSRARLLAALSAWTAPTALLWISLWKPAGFLATDDYILSAISLVVLTAVAVVPLLPWHALALGAAVESMYILSCWLAIRWEIPSSYSESNAHHIFLLMLTLLATGIAATNYEHRREEYESRQNAVRTAEALTGAQLRAQLAENAISIGKMAAAVSHEINSPLGAIRSSVETLVAVTDRLLDAPPEKRQRLIETREELRHSIETSAARIQDVSARLRRFVNLDEAEEKEADLNDLLTDVTLLHQDEIDERHIQLQFDLEKSLPPLTCRPQLLTAAFSNLLSNAIHAVNGDGRVAISTRRHDLDIEVTIADNGRGMSPEEADTIFDPAFKVDGSRVASGNWSLFNSRQIVYEHGGEIRVDTATGKGTAFHVTLPVVG